MKTRKRFRCGRLMLTKDGEIKKIDLKNGGGTRLCDFFYSITFNEIHRRLINIFNLNDTEYDTSLYDFQLLPLAMGQYPSFSKYLYKNGLNCRSTILYICTNEIQHNEAPEVVKKKKKKTPAITSAPIVKIEPDTDQQHKKTIDAIESKPIVKIEPDADQQQINQFDYSFINSSNDLVKNIRDLINQNNFDEILIHLFENICIINGYTCSTIEFVKDQIRESNQRLSLLHPSHINFFRKNLIDVDNIIQATQSLIILHKNKYKMEDFQKLFVEFYQKFKILLNQFEWTTLDSSPFINLPDSTTLSLSSLN